LQTIHASSPQLRIHIQPIDGNFLVMGLRPSLDKEEIATIIKRALERWAS
jgi:hypothetical protein